jgi:beta-1,4-N-acetylglucosaminyltransferase
MALLNLIRSKLFEGKALMIILGSGGHTGEILMMLKNLDLEKFNKIVFVSSHNDNNSEKKAKEVLNLDVKEQKHVQFVKIYRSRNVGQSYLSSIFSTILSTIDSFYILMITRPNLVSGIFI